MEGRELLDDAAIAVEELYLGLRTTDGLGLGRVPETQVRQWEGDGWATVAEGRIRLTPEGWLRLDALVAAIKA